MTWKHGILKKEALQFEAETKVWKEVLNTLGIEFIYVQQHGQDRDRTCLMWASAAHGMNESFYLVI